MNIEERFKYYTKNWNININSNINKFFEIKPEHKIFKQNEVIFYTGPNTPIPENFNNKMGTWKNMFWFFQPELPLDIKCFSISADGINNEHLPCLAKVRYIDNPKGSIIIPLEYRRHFLNPLNELKNCKIIPWNKKKDTCIWRGVRTGIKSGDMRLKFVQLYHDKFNVGICIKNPKNTIDNKKLIKDSITIEDFLYYKYIISIPGNDKDTGLNWKLASNSVVLMSKPKIESWLMEGLLKPYVHYVPLNDNYSNLEEVIKWCKNNDDTVQKIVKNANNFMKQFENFENEKYIFDKIKNYYKNTFKFSY